MREIVDALYALDPQMGQEIEPKSVVPDMALTVSAPSSADPKEPVVPDVHGLGLKDAVFMIENMGLECVYSGTGHVSSQVPKAGQKVAPGSTVTIG